MKIIHFSDSHAGGQAEDWMAYIDKRWVGVFNYHFRRRFQHDLGQLEKAVDYILEVKPDLAVCTGDITSTGQPGEFQKGTAPIKKLRNSSIPLVYVPGNHDYYVYNKKCVESMKETFEYLNTAFNIQFGGLPVKKFYLGIEFIIVNESFPSNLISSCGYLTKENSAFVKKICEEQKQAAVPRILIGHYPIIEDHPIWRIRHRLWGQNDVKKLLIEGKIDISLCGHMHKPYYKILGEGGKGEICAGSITRNKCMATLEYSAEKDIFSYEKIVF